MKCANMLDEIIDNLILKTREIASQGADKEKCDAAIEFLTTVYQPHVKRFKSFANVDLTLENFDAEIKGTQDLFKITMNSFGSHIVPIINVLGLQETFKKDCVKLAVYTVQMLNDIHMYINRESNDIKKYYLLVRDKQENKQNNPISEYTVPVPGYMGEPGLMAHATDTLATYIKGVGTILTSPHKGINSALDNFAANLRQLNTQFKASLLRPGQDGTSWNDIKEFFTSPALTRTMTACVATFGLFVILRKAFKLLKYKVKQMLS